MGQELVEKPKRGEDWGGIPLQEITGESMFELRDLKAPRLWMLPPALMETALELFGDDRLAHPEWAVLERMRIPCSQFRAERHSGRLASSSQS